MIAQHIHNAYSRQTNLIEVGTLSHASAYKQSTVAATLNGQTVARCVLVVDEILGSSDKVVKHVLLLQLCASHVPVLAILTSTAQYGVYIYAATLQEGYIVRHEERSISDIETAVAVEQQRIASVELHALLVCDEERGAGAVLACVEHHLGLVVVRAEIDFGCSPNGALVSI